MAKPEPEPRLLTVGEVADLVLRPGANRNALIARIRHWTREGLLHTSGAQRRPGTGHPIVYDQWAIYDAALLNVLADQGLQAGHMEPILEWARNTAWDARIEITNNGAVSFHRGSAGPVNLHGGEVSIVVNLARIRDAVSRRLGYDPFLERDMFRSLGFDKLIPHEGD